MFHFLANLKPYTFYRGRGNPRFNSYLLSIDNFGEHEELSKKVVKQGRFLCADNGNVDNIQEFINAFSSKAKELHILRRNEEALLSHTYARPGDLSILLTEKFSELGREIADKAKSVFDISYIRNVIQLQNKMNPSYIIGMEDLTIVTLTGLNLEPEYTNIHVSDYEEFIYRAISFAKKTEEFNFGEVNSDVFAGLHAINYDTAIKGGELAGAENVFGIASGLLGALKDKSYTNFRIENGQIIESTDSYPRSYVRVAEIAAGFFEGYAKTAGKRLRFHALGAGSPILLLIIGVLGDNMTFNATDSTAPIQDAVAHPIISLYVDEPAPRKLNTFKIADYWLKENKGWSCSCPYCKKFDIAFPPDLQSAKNWWLSEGRRNINKYDMNSNRQLSNYFPLLCRHTNPEKNNLANLTRIGHNHWILKRIEKKIRNKLNNPTEIIDWLHETIDTYVSLPGTSKSWALSAKIASQITIKTAIELSGIPSNP